MVQASSANVRYGAKVEQRSREIEATRAEIWAAVRTLSDDHREPFLLIEVFGLSYREASDVLHVRVGTVKSRMHRARKNLIRQLSDEEDAGEV